MPILLVLRNGEGEAGRWKAGEIVAAFEDSHRFTPKEQPDGGNFFHIAVTDKTLDEVTQYLESWRHNPTIEQVARQGNNRLIEVTSSMVSASGKNSFIREDIEALLLLIGGTYDSHTQTSFRFSITATNDEAPFIIEQIETSVRNMQYARRRWYITQAGMTYLGNNGGTVSGTASQVAGYMRDGLLD